MNEKVSIDASFSVSWTHRLRFSANAFSDGTLHALFQELAPLKVLTVIDGGVHTNNSVFCDTLHDWISSSEFNHTEPLIVQGGEEAKNNMQVVDVVLEALNSNNLCRRSCVLVVGGGAVLDAVGYATSIAHRGIPIIRMPSTTLAQCDSGIGVKNAVNYFGKKNFIGVFDPPFAVVNDTRLLTSLDDKHWRSGLSEAVKVALVKDADFFRDIESCSEKLVERDMETMARVINKSAILHFEHITNGGDPFERLDARPLDFGHWSAHKLEQMTGHTLTHGEAVSIGLAIDVRCSVGLGLLDDKTACRAIALLQALGLPTAHCDLLDDVLFEGIEEFRQHLGGQLTLLMLKGIAEPIDVHALDASVVRQAIDELM
jgi:3-dehydroquinate synthase